MELPSSSCYRSGRQSATSNLLSSPAFSKISPFSLFPPPKIYQLPKSSCLLLHSPTFPFCLVLPSLFQPINAPPYILIIRAAIALYNLPHTPNTDLPCISMELSWRVICRQKFRTTNYIHSKAQALNVFTLRETCFHVTMLLPFRFSFSTHGFMFLHQKQGKKKVEKLLMWKKDGNGREVWGNLSIIKSHIYLSSLCASFTWFQMVYQIAHCENTYKV